MLIRWPAEPVKLIDAFWPGTLVAMDVPVPPTVAVAVLSGGTSYNLTVTVPYAGPERAVPSGFRMVVLRNVIGLDTDRLIRCPGLPVNVASAFCPGAVTATVTAAPPGRIGAETSSGTS